MPRCPPTCWLTLPLALLPACGSEGSSGAESGGSSSDSGSGGQGTSGGVSARGGALSRAGGETLTNSLLLGQFADVSTENALTSGNRLRAGVTGSGAGAAAGQRGGASSARPERRSATVVPLCVLVAALGCQGELSNPSSLGAAASASSVPGGSGSGGTSAGAGGPSASGAPMAGNPGNGGSVSTSPTGGGTGGVAPPVTCDLPTAPRAPLRRITRFEYNNTARDLLGLTSRPADALPGEESGSGFGNDADALGVSRLLIDGYRVIAKQIAEEVTQDAAAVARLTGCDPALTGEAACRQSFLADYLTRAFRRPPDTEALNVYDTAFMDGQTLGGSFAAGARAVVERSLQSPQFLYRIEVGQPVDAARGLARPTGYEMATRLSYVLWGSMPDRALLDAAAQGTLDTREGVLAEARRLLDDPRARDSLRYFHGQLLGIGGLDHLERDPGFYPTFQPGMGALFRQETERFLDDVLWNGAGDMATVFTAPYTFVNGTLATFYGIPGVTGDTFQKVSLDPAQRSGLLTQASIMAITTPGSRNDPVVRGKWFYTKMLCGTVDDPPPDVPKLPDPVPGQTVRERLAMHRASPVCAGCHALMDPIGFGFENFDGVGLWRDLDNGVPIDPSGEIPTTDVAGPFRGAVEFGQRLSQSQDVLRCYAGRYLTYAYGRAVTAADACSVGAVETAFQNTGGNVKELILAVTQTDGFLWRTLSTPEQ